MKTIAFLLTSIVLFMLAIVLTTCAGCAAFRSGEGLNTGLAVDSPFGSGRAAWTFGWSKEQRMTNAPPTAP